MKILLNDLIDGIQLIGDEAVEKLNLNDFYTGGKYFAVTDEIFEEIKDVDAEEYGNLSTLIDEECYMARSLEDANIAIKLSRYGSSQDEAILFGAYPEYGRDGISFYGLKINDSIDEVYICEVSASYNACYLWTDFRQMVDGQIENGYIPSADRNKVLQDFYDEKIVGKFSIKPSKVDENGFWYEKDGVVFHERSLDDLYNEFLSDFIVNNTECMDTFQPTDQYRILVADNGNGSELKVDDGKLFLYKVIEEKDGDGNYTITIEYDSDYAENIEMVNSLLDANAYGTVYSDETYIVKYNDEVKIFSLSLDGIDDIYTEDIDGIENLVSDSEDEYFITEVRNAVADFKYKSDDFESEIENLAKKQILNLYESFRNGGGYMTFEDEAKRAESENNSIDWSDDITDIYIPTTNSFEPLLINDGGLSFLNDYIKKESQGEYRNYSGIGFDETAEDAEYFYQTDIRDWIIPYDILNGEYVISEVVTSGEVGVYRACDGEWHTIETVSKTIGHGYEEELIEENIYDSYDVVAGCRYVGSCNGNIFWVENTDEVKKMSMDEILEKINNNEVESYYDDYRIIPLAEINDWRIFDGEIRYGEIEEISAKDFDVVAILKDGQLKDFGVGEKVAPYKKQVENRTERELPTQEPTNGVKSPLSAKDELDAKIAKWNPSDEDVRDTLSEMAKRADEMSAKSGLKLG
ncbi:MAG: hypothetical protein PHO62_08030 [Sulfurimonas sp.]|uniref:hypothetical protein n=1 Tax=Sulfurimonas sp. TaxID=2022749 RepID=UPI00261C080D|nr:hypothetical protein [Sulfurimonas sp.]MDD5373356.1 hypothetical protein [Sulfurimonas sp.]